MFFPRTANDFYPRPPRGGRPTRQSLTAAWTTISIHALREEGDAPRRPCKGGCWHFYPRPPRGGRHKAARLTSRATRISIHALREEGDDLKRWLNGTKPISIHALREEGDHLRRCVGVAGALFLSTPSARRATTRRLHRSVSILYFYPRPPRGGRLPGRAMPRHRGDFYPRPPRGGRLQDFTEAPQTLAISIHALREEGDHR